MSDDVTTEEKRNAFLEWVKPSSVVPILSFVVVIGMGWQRLGSLEMRVDQMELREREARDILIEIRSDVKLMKAQVATK